MTLPLHTPMAPKSIIRMRPRVLRSLLDRRQRLKLLDCQGQFLRLLLQRRFRRRCQLRICNQLTLGCALECIRRRFWVAQYQLVLGLSLRRRLSTDRRDDWPSGQLQGRLADKPQQTRCPGNPWALGNLPHFAMLMTSITSALTQRLLKFSTSKTDRGFQHILTLDCDVVRISNPDLATLHHN